MADKKTNSKTINPQEKANQGHCDGHVSDPPKSSHNPMVKTSMRILEGVSELNHVESERQDSARLKPLIINRVEIKMDDSDLVALLEMAKERKKAREEKEETERREQEQKERKRKRKERKRMEREKGGRNKR